MIAIPLVSCDTPEGNETDIKTEAPETEAPNAFEDEALYVGYGRECITPYDESGNLKTGYYLTGYAEARDAKSVLADMYLSCTAVKDKDGDIALIYTLDLHSMTVEFAKMLQREVNKALDIPEENMIFNVTHTHAVPTANQLSDTITAAAISAGKTAIDDLSLVTELYAGNITVDNMNFIRRYITDENGKPIAHIAENDPEMPVVRFVREGDKKDIILCNWAAHCDTVITGSPNAISSDYVGYFRKRLEENLDAHVSFHLGASGDVNPNSRLEGEPQEVSTVLYGRTLAGFVEDNLSTLKRCEIKSDVKSSIKETLVYFDKSEPAELGEKAEEVHRLYVNAGNIVTEEVNDLMNQYGFKDIYDAAYTYSRYKAGVRERMNVGALSIGNIVFAIAPYEMFTINGVRVKASADEFDLAFMCAYSNGMIGYIASEEAFEYDIYEVYSHLYVKETATILQDTIIASIDELGK